MIYYRYVTALTPPAPFVNVTLRCPSTGREATGLPAQIDTAADRTVLPSEVDEAMGLADDGRELFQGFGGQLMELPMYLVALVLHDCPAIKLRAVRGEHEPHILLGRDFLNALRILLDGPRLALEIG